MTAADYAEQIAELRHRAAELAFQRKLERDPKRREFIDRKRYALAQRVVQLREKQVAAEKREAERSRSQLGRDYKTLRSMADAVKRQRAKARR